MSAWEFDKLITGCQPVYPPGNYGKMYLLPAPGTTTRGVTNWLVGSYKSQTKMATAIREDKALQDFFGEHAIRLGLRDSDVPPAFIDRKERYGTGRPGAGVNADTPRRKVETALPSGAGAAFGQRKTDLWQNVKDYWDSQTPQSHHIVEFNHLAKLGLSHEVGANDLDHAQLPCVLLAAEFHQKYISIILKETHHWDNTHLRKEIRGVYHRLYTLRSLLFQPLWKVSEVILTTAGLAA